MKRLKGIPKFRKWSADMTNPKINEDRNDDSNEVMEVVMPTNTSKMISALRRPINHGESNLINCENIKISIIQNNEEEIEKDSLDLGKNLTISKKSSDEIDNNSLLNKEVRYGSPAIWLKNKKRNSVATEYKKGVFSSRNPLKLKKANNTNTELYNRDIEASTFFKVKKSSPIMLKIKSEDIVETNHSRNNQFVKQNSYVNQYEKLKFYDESSFNLNLSANMNHFKSLIYNKVQKKNQERKFNNLNHLGLNKQNTIDRTEIDEIINTEVSEIFIKSNLNEDQNVKTSYKLKNKITKIKNNNNYNFNLLKTSKNQGENEVNGISNSDKVNMGNIIDSKTNSESLEKYASEMSKNSQSSSLFKTMKDNLQLDIFLHKIFNGKIKWKAGEIIAEGSSSVIYKALNEVEGNIFVVKRYSKINDPKMMETFSNEVKIFQNLNHPNVIKYIDSDIIDKNLFIYLEYVSGGSIKYIIDKYGPLNENLTKIYLKQILNGLEYLHSKKIVHRDLKCANILLDVKGNIKLSDFGCSSQMDVEKYSEMYNSEEFLDSLKGTLPWMAPEVILQQKYGKKADIWSLGCTILEFVTGSPPWGKLENCFQAMNIIGRSNEIPSIPDNISDDLKDFLSLCLNRNPKERPNVGLLMQHKFVNHNSLHE